MRMTSIAITLLFLAPRAALAQFDKPPEPKQPVPQQVEPAQPHPSFIPGPGAAQIDLDLPRDRMTEALKQIDKKEFKEAGKHLKSVVEAMQAAADTSHGEAIKANVLRSVVELSSKVERLRSGTAASPEEMTAMFSRALQALGEHHAALAQAHFQAGDNVSAGQDLRASVLNVNQAMVWGNVKATPDDTNQLSLGGRTAKNLIEQKIVDKVGAQKVIVDLQHWIHDLRGRLPKAAA
jgi:hypothetical protein